MSSAATPPTAHPPDRSEPLRPLTLADPFRWLAAGARAHLLGLGALVLMFGAWQIANVQFDGSELPSPVQTGPGAHVRDDAQGDASATTEVEAPVDAGGKAQGSKGED